MRHLISAVLSLVLISNQLLAVEVVSKNFVVSHSSEAVAQRVSAIAEQSRKDVSLLWLSRELPTWRKRCHITVEITNGGPGGITSFSFDRGEVSGWRMKVVGRLLDLIQDAVPHEVTHTIMASHFRRPLPRWLDEGMATMTETAKEKENYKVSLQQTWRHRVRFRQLFDVMQYPRDMNKVMAMYSSGHYATRYLVEKRGRAEFLEFVETAHMHGWDMALRSHYGFQNVEHMEADWYRWMVAGAKSNETQVAKIWNGYQCDPQGRY